MISEVVHQAKNGVTLQGLQIPVAAIGLALIAVFAITNWLLLAFLGLAGQPIALVSGLLCLALLAACWLGLRPKMGQNVVEPNHPNQQVEVPTTTGTQLFQADSGGAETPQAQVSLQSLGICFVLAVILLVLGGEGRILYANPDWQIRDAVLYDMTKTPWPYDYRIDGDAHILRAPLGMYLVPALAAKAAPDAVDLILLISNSLVLALLLAAAGSLFQSTRHKMIALIVFLAFSGLDILGNLGLAAAGGPLQTDHLEQWADGRQYSSIITLLFWVPQHAFAGWLCAVCIILYLRQQMRLGMVMAAIPLSALWSPFAVMGAAPFALWIGVKALLARQIKPLDVVIGALGLAIALPALAYLTAGTQALTQGLSELNPWGAFALLVFEVVPWLWLMLRLGGWGKLGGDIVVLTFGLLFLIPFGQIGSGSDFEMRASIPALAILAMMVAMSLCDNDRLQTGLLRFAVVAIMSVAAMTGLFEVARAFRNEPAPRPDCTLPQIWFKQTGRVAELDTYMTATQNLPTWLQAPGPRHQSDEPKQENCWAKPWVTPR